MGHSFGAQRAFVSDIFGIGLNKPERLFLLPSPKGGIERLADFAFLWRAEAP